MKLFLKSAILLVAVLTLTFATQSCSSIKTMDKSQLEDTTWVLKSLKGEDAQTAFTGKSPDLTFDFSKNTISGNGGCNRYSGSFTLTGNVFSSPNLAATMMACLPGNKEPQFLAALSSPDLVASLTKGGTLTFSKGKEVVLEFEKSQLPAISADLKAEALVGKWNLTSISGGDIATLFTDKVPTMEISNDGKVFGNAGCNTYRSTYTLEKNTVTFGPAMSTKMACPNLKGEELLTSLLSTPLQAGLNGNKLTFSKGGNVVLEFAKAVE